MSDSMILGLVFGAAVFVSFHAGRFVGRNSIEKILRRQYVWWELGWWGERLRRKKKNT